MGTIRGAMLLPLDSPAYRRHLAHHTFLARVNAGETTPDFRQAFTSRVEQRARAALGEVLMPTRYRVLRWEEIGPTHRSTVRYRELDGVFTTGDGRTVVVEVKASASKGSLRAGLEQLRASLKAVSTALPKVSGLLVVADLRSIVEGFSGMPGAPSLETAIGTETLCRDWPPRPPAGPADGLSVSFVPPHLAAAWVEDLVDEPLAAEAA